MGPFRQPTRETEAEAEAESGTEIEAGTETEAGAERCHARGCLPTYLVPAWVPAFANWPARSGCLAPSPQWVRGAHVGACICQLASRSGCVVPTWVPAFARMARPDWLRVADSREPDCQRDPASEQRASRMRPRTPGMRYTPRRVQRCPLDRIHHVGARHVGRDLDGRGGPQQRLHREHILKDAIAFGRVLPERICGPR
jgi:hypothetical protein